MLNAAHPNWSKPAQVSASLGEGLKKVDPFAFGKIGDQTLARVGEDPTPFPVDQALLSSPQVLAMVSDPAHGGKISEGNIQEAVVGLKAQQLKVLPNLHREATGGAEFVDSAGQPWDVKSPLSPPVDPGRAGCAMPSYTWVFDADHQLTNLRHDISEGDNVLLDLSRCNSTDGAGLLSLLMTELTPQEKAKLLVFHTVTQLPKSDS